MTTATTLIEALRRTLGLDTELIETHISWLLLAGADAYKLKKPVKLDFLDFSRLEQRRAACDEELRINRRTAPDLYRGVLPVTGSPDVTTLGLCAGGQRLGADAHRQFRHGLGLCRGARSRAGGRHGLGQCQGWQQGKHGSEDQRQATHGRLLERG